MKKASNICLYCVKRLFSHLIAISFSFPSLALPLYLTIKRPRRVFYSSEPIHHTTFLWHLKNYRSRPYFFFAEWILWIPLTINQIHLFLCFQPPFLVIRRNQFKCQSPLLNHIRFTSILRRSFQPAIIRILLSKGL